MAIPRWERLKLEAAIVKAVSLVLDRFDEEIVEQRKSREASCRAFRRDVVYRIGKNCAREDLRGVCCTVIKTLKTRVVVKVGGVSESADGEYKVTPGLLEEVRT